MNDNNLERVKSVRVTKDMAIHIRHLVRYFTLTSDRDAPLTTESDAIRMAVEHYYNYMKSDMEELERLRNPKIND